VAKKKRKKDPKKQAIGKSSRNKGQRYERKWVHMLREFHCDLTAKRNLSETRDPDLDIETSLPWAFQVRSGEGVSIWKALEEAQVGQKKRNKRWAMGVIFETRPKGKRKGNPPFPPFVVAPLDEFVEFFEEACRIKDSKIIEVTKAKPALRQLIRDTEFSSDSDWFTTAIFVLDIEGRPAAVGLFAAQFLFLVQFWLKEQK